MNKFDRESFLQVIEVSVVNPALQQPILRQFAAVEARLMQFGMIPAESGHSLRNGFVQAVQRLMDPEHNEEFAQAARNDFVGLFLQYRLMRRQTLRNPSRNHASSYASVSARCESRAYSSASSSASASASL